MQEAAGAYQMGGCGSPETCREQACAELFEGTLFPQGRSEGAQQNQICRPRIEIERLASRSAVEVPCCHWDVSSLRAMVALHSGPRIWHGAVLLLPIDPAP